MKKITVNTKPESYNVYIGKGIENAFTEIASEAGLYNNAVWVVDKNAYKYHKEKIDRMIDSFDSSPVILKFDARESRKTLESLSSIYNIMVKKGLGRDSALIAVGGGITGDVCGFAASSYMRGIQFVQIPTTLLAAVDSSVGGKTAVNFGDTKNIIGAFYQPKFVMIDTEYFSSLPKDELVCGIGETIKYGFLINEEMFDYVIQHTDKLLNLDPATINRIIEDSVSFKANVVAEDEKEGGLRKILNLGHTFAHALEVEQNHKIKHGQAVIAGIACAAFLSNKTGLLKNHKFDKALGLLLKYREYVKIKNPNKNTLYKIMLRDKKNRDGKIKFVLFSDFGKTLIDVEIEKSDVMYALNEGLKYFSSK